MLHEHITGLFTLRAAHSKEGLPKLGEIHCFVKKDQSCIRKRTQLLDQTTSSVVTAAMVQAGDRWNSVL